MRSPETVHRRLCAAVAAVALVGVVLPGPALASGPAWNGPFQPMPSGSYQLSCRDISAFNDTVFARCLDGYGGWTESQIYLPSCPEPALVNERGRLRCQGGYGGPSAPVWDGGCRPGQPGGLIVYENPDYRGAKRELCDSSSDLAASGLDDQITSVRVMKGTWLLCAGRDFNGQCWTVEADVANLKLMGANDKISSIRRLKR